MFQYKNVTLEINSVILSHMHTHLYLSSEVDSGGKVIGGRFKG